MKLRHLLEDTLTGWHITADDRQFEQLEKYADLLAETNKVMNLTAITDAEGIAEKHFLDSLALAAAADLTGVRTVIDVGTGAGFPGIPLKILFPHLEVTLADSLAKRVGFLQRVIDEIMLTDITAVHGRAEDLARKPEYREKFDLAVSRAVAKLSVLSEYCLPFVREGGLFAAYKASESGAEIKDAEYAVEVLGGRIEDTADLTFGPSPLSRTFCLIRKKKATPAVYPRKSGTPEKKPLEKKK